MPKSTVRWRGKQFEARTRSDMESRMRKAAEVIRSRQEVKVSREQAVRSQAEGKGAGRQVGLDPSKEGEPPKVVSSRLKVSHQSEVISKRREIIGRAGTNVKYARRLELGFHGPDSAGRNIDQNARPWLVPALRESEKVVARILGVRK